MKSLLTAIEFDERKVNTYIVLLSAPVLLTVYRYYGHGENFGSYFPALQSHTYFDLYRTLYQFVSFAVLTFAVPLLFIKSRLNRPLTDFGFGLGDVKFGFPLLAITIPFLLVPAAWLASKIPEVRIEYPLSKILHTHHELILWYEAAYVFIFYVSWEFFFRGFLLFFLKEQFGGMNAILIQTISSCLIHIGKPQGEIIGSIFVGVLFGAIALRARSFWYVWILHAGLGVLIDLFIIYF